MTKSIEFLQKEVKQWDGKLIEGTIAFGTLIEPIEEKKKITLESTQEQIDKIQ